MIFEFDDVIDGAYALHWYFGSATPVASAMPIRSVTQSTNLPGVWPSSTDPQAFLQYYPGYFTSPPDVVDLEVSIEHGNIVSVHGSYWGDTKAGLQQQFTFDGLSVTATTNIIAAHHYAAQLTADGQLTAVPEPSAWALWTVGMGVLAWRARLRGGIGEMAK